MEQEVDMKRASTIFMLLCLFTACRYGRPWLTVPTEDKDTYHVDSSGQTQYHEAYFLCLRTGIHTGLLTVSKTYDKKGRLIEEEREKNTWIGVCDGPNRWITKEIHYDTLGKVNKIRYEVVQDGWGSRTIVDKSIIYHHGRRVRSVE